MPYELGTIWNVTSKYIYNTLDKNIGIGTTTPICELDVYCNIAENGIKLEDKYHLKPEHNKKYDLIVREDLDQDHSQLIIWYKFNKEDFTSNYSSKDDTFGQQYGTLTTEKGTISNLQKEYYVGTGSAEINDELYYKINMTNKQFNLESYTFCFWLFLNEECDNNRYILNLKDANGDIFNFKYEINKLIINKNANSIEYNYSLDKNKWHHISIIISDANSSDKRILLVNGIRINNTSDNITGVLLRDTGEHGSADIYLGYISNSINGYIDDFRIYATNLSTDDIRTNIIGKITKITPGNIRANGNYGIDIVNYSNLINVGTENSNVDLTIYGDLTVISNFNINSIDIIDATFQEITANNITATSIIENDKTLINKYALIGSIDKNTDIIVSKMIDSDDVNALYDRMPAFFRSNLIIAYNFDYDFDNINNSNIFFRNRSYDENSLWNTYNITPIIEKENIIDYYGTKYVKGNASLHCYSNADGIHYYNFETITNNYATFHNNKNYTISFWIRLNKISTTQNIFQMGSGFKKIYLKLDANNKLVFINGNEPDITVDGVSFKKDEWYHICIILKNISNIYVTRSDFQGDDYDDLIERFEALRYSHSINGALPDIIQFNNNDYGDSGSSQPALFIYINGIKYKDHTYIQAYNEDKLFFGSVSDANNFIGVSPSLPDTNYLDGFIDDFKIYETIVPIQYINKHIIGDALVIKPGQLSAIGNYGINIENFNNLVSIGQQNTNVNLYVYGLLNVVNDTIRFSNIQIDAIENVLSTSNITVTNILNTNSNISSNITVSNSIVGDGFILGSSSNLIDYIEITTLNNSNLNSSNITADTITVTNELKLKSAILSNITIVGIDIDNSFSISNDDIIIRSNLIIGDNSSNAYRYDFDSLDDVRKLNIKDVNDPDYETYSNFKLYLNRYGQFPTILDTENTQVFDKSIIFYGNTDEYDIHFKNNYIRDENCNIKEEIEKSYFEGDDRRRTRIKLDVGNISLQNGFIELKHIDILENNVESATLSILKIEENQISITSNANTTILNHSLMLSNAGNYCLLTNSNFMFNNDNGFINTETLKINKIEITEELDINKINTGNSNFNMISIDTSNASIIGKIRGHLCSNSIIDITDEIKTASNITGNNIKINNTLDTSNIICEYEIRLKEDSTDMCNTIIKKHSIDVHNLHIYGGITLGQETGSADNSIEGSFGSLNIRTIKTTNSNEDIFSIDTLSNTYLGKIRGFLSSNSEINITGLIETSSNIIGIDITASNTLYTSNIQGINGDLCSIIGKLENDSIININCNITTTQDIHCINQFTSNTLYASNIQSINGDLCSIIGILENDSIININCNITTKQDINCINQFTSNTLYASNIQGINGDLCSIIGKLESNSDINISGLIETSSNIIAENIIINHTLYASNITVSNILITDSVSGTYLTASNTLYASNIQGIPGGDLCSIIGILENDSIININCNITTTQDINCINQFTSNTLYASKIEGIPGGDRCSITGKLESDSVINISGLIETSSNIIATNITINDTLYVSNITDSSTNDYFITSSNSGIFVNKIQTNNNLYNVYSIDTLVDGILGKIRAKLADNSEIDINGIIKTTGNIEANILFIDTIDTYSSEINIASTLKCDIIELNTINSDFDITQALNVINARTTGNGTYTGVELSNDHIKWYDQTEVSYIKINNTGLFSKKEGKNNNKEYEIISYNDANDIKIKCNVLEVESFDVGDGSRFSFPNIIDYSKSTHSTYNIPNVYIGDDKTKADINEELDVLYVDTPPNTRLNTGNLLVRDILEISPDSSINTAIKSMKIFTGYINTLSGSREAADIITSPFTNFTNQNGDTIISCSLDTNSVGINTQPGITDDDIKLYIEGGIQCSKDIVAFANVSDKRFKTNITSFDNNDIDIVNKLNPVRFIWKDNLFNSNMANKPDIGFIAQEVKEVIPEAVSVCKIEMDDIDYNYIKYERIIPYLVNNIKYLNNKIVELENKLNGI